MGEAVARVAIDSLIPREGNTVKDAAAHLVKRSSKEVKDKETLHAASAVVATQIGTALKDPLIDAATADSLEEGHSFVANQVARPSTLQEARRYKNPILAIFAVMSVARRTMQDVAKSSKEQTRLVKKHWEQLSHEVSDHYDKSSKSSENVNNWSGALTTAITVAPMLLTTMFPKDDRDYTDFIQKLDGGRIESLLSNFMSRTPSEVIAGFAADHKAMAELIKQGQTTAQHTVGPITQQWGQTVSMENQRDVAVGQQRSQASQTEFQSRQEEKRSEDEAVRNIEQTLQRLMEQEARTFEVRG